MNRTIVVEAIYENGVLKPSQALGLEEKQVVQICVKPGIETEHPHITATPGICGGRPAVKGTRIPVKTLVRYYQNNPDAKEVLAGFPHLTVAQLYDALSYYHDHQAEIDADMEADELPALLTQFNLQMTTDGILSRQD